MNRVRVGTGVLVVAALIGGVMPAEAQDLHPSRRPSPVGIARTHLGDTYVKVTYGRPYARGRDIFGAAGGATTYLVPFGEVWRTGANEATELTTTGPLMVAGERLEAGTYSVFTVPGASSWEIRFSPQLGLDGTAIFNPETGQVTPAYDESRDVLTVTLPSGRLEEPVDQFTIEFEDSELVLSWERTEVRIPVAPAS